MKSLKQYKEMQMENPEFVKEYESIQPEMDVIRAIIEARTSRKLPRKNWQSVQELIRQISANSNT